MFVAWLSIRTVDPTALSDDTVDAIWRLYRAHHQTSRQRLVERLHERLGRIHLFYVGPRLVGFLGMREEVLTLPERGRICAFYMGLGFLRREYRNLHFVQRAVVGQLVRFRLRHPLMPVYFWTDALSYKPYLLIARNLSTFHPSRHRPAGPDLARLQELLGRRHYGDNFRHGTVHKRARLLRRGTADVLPADLRDPDVAFYAQQNPGHDRGDGLLVVLPGSLANVLSWLTRRIRRSRAR